LMAVAFAEALVSARVAAFSVRILNKETKIIRNKSIFFIVSSSLATLTNRRSNTSIYCRTANPKGEIVRRRTNKQWISHHITVASRSATQVMVTLGGDCGVP